MFGLRSLCNNKCIVNIRHTSSVFMWFAWAKNHFNACVNLNNMCSPQKKIYMHIKHTVQLYCVNSLRFHMHFLRSHDKWEKMSVSRVQKFIWFKRLLAVSSKCISVCFSIFWQKNIFVNISLVKKISFEKTNEKNTWKKKINHKILSVEIMLIEGINRSERFKQTWHFENEKPISILCLIYD